MIKRSWKLKINEVIIYTLLFVVLLLIKDYFFEKEFQSIVKYLLQGIFFGFFMGIGLPYLMGKLGKGITSSALKTIQPELTDNEEIEIEGPANLFRGMEAVGGKLVLTTKRLIFKSHKLNIQRGEIHIEYRDIEKIMERKTMKLIDNGIRVKTVEGKEFDFVVNEREKWMDKLTSKLN